MPEVNHPVTADRRVIAAREFLTGARSRKIAELPPSVLAREAAEPPRLATAKKTRSKPGTSGKKTSAEKGPALSAWLGE